MVLCLSLSELEARNQSQQQAQLQETRHAAELLSQRAEKGTVYLSECLIVCLYICLSVTLCQSVCLSVCQLNCRKPGKLLNYCLRGQRKVLSVCMTSLSVCLSAQLQETRHAAELLSQVIFLGYPNRLAEAILIDTTLLRIYSNLGL